MDESYVYRSGRFVFNVTDAIVGIIEIGLVVRLVLEFFGANPQSGFAQWIFMVTDSLMRPFIAIFPSYKIGPYLLSMSTIIALVAYAILGWIVSYFLGLVLPVRLLTPNTHADV